MILMALVCTALTKPLVLLIEKITSDTSDPYSFADLHHNISPITQTLRRASRIIYGTEAPAEWSLPTIHVAVIPEDNEGDHKQAAAAAAAAPTDFSPTAPVDSEAASSPATWSWLSSTAKSAMAATPARQISPADAAANGNGTPPPSPSTHLKNHQSTFRHISKVRWNSNLNII